MKRPIDQHLLDQLSAYMDGALSPADMAEIEHLVDTDPAVAAELDALSRVDHLARAAFDSLLTAPVPLALARTVDHAAPAEQPAAPPQAANLSSAPVWRTLVAALALVLIGGAGGAYLAQSSTTSRMAWLDQVADYHRVYATQSRHLVEVPASETDHLQKWLSSTTGVPFTVPDLVASGLTFQGGRLLVASGKPVAQLMYTNADGQVVAVCFLAGGDAAVGSGHTAPTARNTGGVHMVWWTSKDASYVVVGPTSGIDLQSVADAVSTVL